jgi:PAS domain S-box-containing protein
MTGTNIQLISLINTHGEYTYVNSNYCQNLGYSQDELLGKNNRDLYSPDMPASVKDEVKTTLGKRIFMANHSLLNLLAHIVLLYWLF